MAYLTGDGLHSVRVVRLLTSSAELLKVNLGYERERVKQRLRARCLKDACRGAAYLVGTLHTPHIGALPSDVAVLAVVVAVFLLQELNKRTPEF